MINKKIIITFFTVTLFLTTKSTELIQGNPDAPEGKSFSFPIKQTLMSSFGNFYVGAHEQLTENQQYALSRLTRGSRSFEPIAPEKVVLNSQVDQDNPLFGAQINALTLLRPVNGSDTPLVVTAANPAVVYLVEKSFNPQQISIVAPEPVKDADGLPSSGIITLNTNITSHTFAVVKPSLGTFGEFGTGIAVLIRGNIDDTTIFSEVDAATGMISLHPRALPLDKESPILTMNTAELSAMFPTASLHWDEVLQRLFIGLDVTSGNDTGNAALAVVVGKLVENGLTLFPIAPEEAFASGNVNNIVGVRNSSSTTQVSVHQLTTMYTSTGLHYLILVGGTVTDPEISKQSVFALPLVNSGEFTGTLAQKDAQPEDQFSTGDVPKLVARNITQPVIDQTNMTQATDAAAQIGGGILSAGSITHIVVRDDTVFAFVGDETTDPQLSGIYSSQALFDATGKIKGWTTWQRAGGTTDAIFSGALNVFDGTLLYTTGATENTVDTVLQTTWSNGNPQGLLPVTTYFNSIFSPANGGIQSLQTFLPSTPGLADITMMTAGGIGGITLIQTGILENGIILPTPAQDFEKVETYDNGTITAMVNAKIVTISGGGLHEVGPITATTIASNGINGWLLVGGSDGLAVLCHSDGSGWNIAANELGNTFDGLTPGMSFKIIGDYSFVKKLFCDDNFLYIITNDRIDRVNLQTINFAAETFDFTTIATKDSLRVVVPRGTILDATISQAFALIATTGGLVRINDNHDVRTITTASQEDWIPVHIPESAGAPTQLLSVTKTGNEQDITRNNGGQLYILTSNEGYNQSRINRFAVEPLGTTEPMQETTLQPFNDLFIENIPSFFLNFGNFNSIFATDGALYFASRSKNNTQPPRVVLTPAYPAPQVAARNVGERSTTVPISFNNGTEINGFQRSQASGSWVVAGNFGMQVLE